MLFLHTVASLNWCANKTILHTYKTVIARAKPAAIHAAVKCAMDCFASLAMTEGFIGVYLRSSAAKMVLGFISVYLCSSVAKIRH